MRFLTQLFSEKVQYCQNRSYQSCLFHILYIDDYILVIDHRICALIPHHLHHTLGLVLRFINRAMIEGWDQHALTINNSKQEQHSTLFPLTDLGY